MSLKTLQSQMPTTGQFLGFVALLLVGLIGGTLAFSISMPLPFMLGGLFSALPFVVWATTKGRTIWVPVQIRRFFVGAIGAMIGGTVTPDILSIIPGLTISLVGMAVFVPAAQGAGFVVARRFGGYDKVTALYAAMPGGLIEAVEFGRKNGADVPVLVLTHFLRIVMVIVLIPTGFFLFTGESVGSAAGQTFAKGGSDLIDIAQIAGLAIVGMWVGKALRLPAYHLVGPMLLSAFVHAGAIMASSPPDWSLYLAQLVVGVSLATHFTGASPKLFIRVCTTTLMQVLAIGVIGGAIAAICANLTGLELPALILSFAPGGVSEMGLIALSLAMSPVVVTAHHVFRIFLTVILASVIARQLKKNA